MSRLPSTFVAVALLATTVAAAQPPPFRSGVDVVLVDLAVLDAKDNPVPGLGAGDVELKVDGKDRAIRTLAFLEAGRRATSLDLTQPSTLPDSELRRTIVLVVDRESIPGGQGQQVLGAAQTFVDRLSPADNVALATMPEPGERLAFNEPREALKKRLGKAVGTWFSAPTAHTIFPWEAVEIVQRNGEVLEQVAQRECRRASESNPSAYFTCRSQIATEARVVVDARRREVDAGLQSLRNLLTALATLDGAKHVVIIGGGIADSPESLWSLASLAQVAAASRVWVHVLQVVNGGNPDWVETEERGLPSRSPHTPTSTAAVNLATATGGLALAPVSGHAFFSRLEKQLAGAYLLAFDPEPSDRDGRPHRIEVRVPQRRGITVRARTQFVVHARSTTTSTVPAPAPVVTPAASASGAAATGASTPTAPPESPARPEAGTTSAPLTMTRPPADPAVMAAVRQMAAYVASYGENAALFVAAERYDQRIEVGPDALRPHTLESEVAIVRTGDTVGWAGFRDVVEADGKQVVDRRDRLQALLTGSADPRAEVRRFADESARYNVGPVMRNFNLPTTALFFFHPSRVGRFAFTPKGTKKIDGTTAVQLDFVEVARPTLIMKRNGTDVPVEGSVWIVPEDGTIVRTRVRLRGFADTVYMGESAGPNGGRRSGPVSVQSQPVYSAPAPVQAPAPVPSGGTPGGGSGAPSTGGSGSSGQGTTGGSQGNTQGGAAVVQSSSPMPAPEPMAAPEFPSIERIESRADVEVTYRKDPHFGVWLPAKMSEIYEGPIHRGTRAPLTGRATAVARYSDYRRFETSATLVP